jgi:hypothetical protein
MRTFFLGGYHPGGQNPAAIAAVPPALAPEWDRSEYPLLQIYDIAMVNQSLQRRPSQ